MTRPGSLSRVSVGTVMLAVATLAPCLALTAMFVDEMQPVSPRDPMRVLIESVVINLVPLLPALWVGAYRRSPLNAVLARSAVGSTFIFFVIHISDRFKVDLSSWLVLTAAAGALIVSLVWYVTRTVEAGRDRPLGGRGFPILASSLLQLWLSLALLLVAILFLSMPF